MNNVGATFPLIAHLREASQALSRAGSIASRKGNGLARPELGFRETIVALNRMIQFLEQGDIREAELEYHRLTRPPPSLLRAQRAKAGAATSEKKAAASRQNGKRGGRPPNRRPRDPDTELALQVIRSNAASTDRCTSQGATQT